MMNQEEVKEEALKFLKKHSTGVIATAALNAQPYVSTIYYAAADDFSIYFITSHTTNKFKNIVLNPKVAFSTGTGPEYVTFQMKGTAKIAEGADREIGEKLLDKIRQKDSIGHWPIQSVSLLKEGGLVVIKIIPDQAFFLNINSSENPDSIADYYYEVIS